MANLITTDTELTSIADAIRAKTGGSAELEYPTEFVSEIGTLTDTSDADAVAGEILNGKTAYVDGVKITGEYVPLDTSDADAVAGEILNGKTAYVNGVKITGSIQSKALEFYNTSEDDRTISAGVYLAGNQTIRGVKVNNLTAANIKAGARVKVGDVSDAGRIKDITGTFTSDATAAAGDIVTGKSAYVNGSKVNGTMLDATGVEF